MRTLGKIGAILGVVGAVGTASVIPASALDVYIGHRHQGYHGYYNYGGGNGCRPGWTVQGGVCKPYRYGPWDVYGGRQSVCALAVIGRFPDDSPPSVIDEATEWIGTIRSGPA
jgi:hypothetical protein